MLQRLRAGEEGVRDELIRGNLRLVISVIQRFNNRGEYVDDLFQVGCGGLMKAIDNSIFPKTSSFQPILCP